MADGDEPASRPEEGQVGHDESFAGKLFFSLQFPMFVSVKFTLFCLLFRCWYMKINGVDEQPKIRCATCQKPACLKLLTFVFVIFTIISLIKLSFKFDVSSVCINVKLIIIITIILLNIIVLTELLL